MPSGPRDDPDGNDSVLVAERDHLRSSREFLRLMRENVLSLRALGGDPVSAEYLKAALPRRAEALIDLPDTPLFFGLLDYAVWPDDAGEVGPGAQFHIGRRHVHDQDGRPVVIDWRSPVSRPFYRASPADPMGVALRRRFGFSGGELTAYEDEDFTAPDRPESASSTSRILIEEIERPRSGPMRDIVATIQPDQDDIVRADAGQTVCVQGAPGTGKTAVGLHRVAYLLYAHREQVRRRGVVMVGPNQAFLSYIRNVLPALGEIDVTQTPVGELVKSVPVRGSDTDAAAVVKGDARMAEVLRRALGAAVRRAGQARGRGDARMAEVRRRALWARGRGPERAVVLARGPRRWRVAAWEIEEL